MNKEKMIILGLTAAAFLLRAYYISETFSFSGEFGHNLLAVKNAISEGHIPLIGPPTSHSWLYFGPFYYWLMIPIMKISGFTPLAGAWVGVISGTLVVLLNFLVIDRIFGRKIATLSSLFIAASPLWISFSRDARFYFLTTLVFYPFFFSLYNIWKSNKKYLFWAGLFYGLIFSFHYSPIILLPTLILVLYQKRKKLALFDYARLIAGFLIPLLPLFIYDSKNAFAMTRNFLLWIPYRVAGFIGLYPKNTVSSLVLKDNFWVINRYFGQSFVANEIFWPFISILLVSFFIYLFLRKEKPQKDFNSVFLGVSLVAGLGGIFVHGSAPIHYFLPLFPIAPLLSAMLVVKLWEKINFRFLILGFGVLFFLLNLRWVLNLQTKEISYGLQVQMAREIAKDAQEREYALERVGPYDYFEGDYAQNYQYLLWWAGNEPVNKANLSYTIYEGKERFPESPENIVFRKDNVLITKRINGEKE
jgi:hypothetical protein